MIMQPSMLTPAEVAAAFKVSAKTITRAAGLGWIPCTRFGRSYRFDPGVIDLLKRQGLPSRTEMTRSRFAPSQRHFSERECHAACSTDATGEPS